VSRSSTGTVLWYLRKTRLLDFALYYVIIDIIIL